MRSGRARWERPRSRAADLVDERVRGARFSHDRVAARGEGGGDVRPIGPPGEADDPSSVVSGPPAHPPRDVEAVPVGEVPVEEDDVRDEPGEEGQRGREVLALDHLEPLTLEHVPEDHSQVLVVIDHDDRRGFPVSTKRLHASSTQLIHMQGACKCLHDA
jgi:hypothetical protein